MTTIVLYLSALLFFVKIFSCHNPLPNRGVHKYSALVDAKPTILGGILRNSKPCEYFSKKHIRDIIMHAHDMHYDVLLNEIHLLQ
jgi:hypothetical protein